MNHEFRDKWLASQDAALFSDCEFDTYRASGPGGQKRNKTSSAVRLRHRPSGLQTIAEESRSQHDNKAKALRRLRMTIALGIRCPVDLNWQPPVIFFERITRAGRLEISQRHADYPLVAAVMLDALAAREGRVREAAELVGLSTGQFSRFLTADGKILAAANEIRRAAKLGPIRSE